MSIESEFLGVRRLFLGGIPPLFGELAKWASSLSHSGRGRGGRFRGRRRRGGGGMK